MSRAAAGSARLSLAWGTPRAVLCDGCRRDVGVSHHPPLHRRRMILPPIRCFPPSPHRLLGIVSPPPGSPRHLTPPPPPPRFAPPAPTRHIIPPLPPLAPLSCDFPLVVVVISSSSSSLHGFLPCRRRFSLLLRILSPSFSF